MADLAFRLEAAEPAAPAPAMEVLGSVQALIRSRLGSYGPALESIRVIIHARQEEETLGWAHLDALPRHGVDAARRCLAIEYASWLIQCSPPRDAGPRHADAIRAALDEVCWALRLARMHLVGTEGFDVEALLRDLEQLRTDLPVTESGVLKMVDAARRRCGGAV